MEDGSRNRTHFNMSSRTAEESGKFVFVFLGHSFLSWFTFVFVFVVQNVCLLCLIMIINDGVVFTFFKKRIFIFNFSCFCAIDLSDRMLQ